MYSFAYPCVVASWQWQEAEIVRVVQISDTHIGKQRARFMESWKPTLEWIRQQNPALLLHGGDITLDDSPLGGLRVIIRVPA